MTKHSHYHKDVSHLKTIDVYRTLELFGVTDQALGHAIKKLLCAGERGAGKTFEQDVREAVDTLNRRLQMLAEDDRQVTKVGVFNPGENIEDARKRLGLPPIGATHRDQITGHYFRFIEGEFEGWSRWERGAKGATWVPVRFVPADLTAV